MDEQSSVLAATTGQIDGASVNAGETITMANADGDMVQYVIYSGEGDGPIGIDELRDALSKLTGQQVSFNESQEGAAQEIQLQSDEMSSDLSTVTQAALSQDSDLNFRLSAESMVGEVSFVDDNVVMKHGDKSSEPRADITYRSNRTSSGNELDTSRLVIDDNNTTTVSQLLKNQNQPAPAPVQTIPAQVTIDTEFGPITLETSKLTPGQLAGTEQITVNVLTQDADGETTHQRGLKLQPGMLAKLPAPAPAAPQEIRLTGFPDTVNDETIQGSDFASVLQQLTDLCSEQNPLPVQVTQINQGQEMSVNESDSAASALEDYINLKFPDTPKQSGQKTPMEVSKLESYLKNKYSGARLQVQSTPVLPTKVTVDSLKVCCAAHSELKSQEIRRKMLPIPLNVTKCPECTLDLGNRKSLRLHIQRYHVTDFKHVCENRIKIRQMHKPEIILNDAPIVVDSSYFQDEENKNKTYPCAVCDEVFITRRDYLRHIYDHGKKVVHCSVCNKRFTNISALTTHVNYVHNGKTQYQCRHCAHKFSSMLQWRQHEKKHKSPQRGTIRCLFCKCLIPQLKFRKHMAALHKIAYKPMQDCAFCGDRFKSSESLALHTRKYHNFEKYEHLCPICYKAYPGSEERDGHIISYHNDEEMMECEVEFSTEPKDCYKRQCARCGKMFSSYARLKKHYDKHGDEKTQCLICGQDFHWIANLDQHYKREHVADDLVKFGIQTPTLNLIRHDQGFELVAKNGRMYSSKLDLGGQTEDPEELCGKITLSDFDHPPLYRMVTTSSPEVRVEEFDDESQVVVRRPPPKRASKFPVMKSRENTRTIIIHPDDLGITVDEAQESEMLMKKVQETIAAARTEQMKKQTTRNVDREQRRPDGRLTSPAIERATALARKVMATKQAGGNVAKVLQEHVSKTHSVRKVPKPTDKGNVNRDTGNGSYDVVPVVSDAGKDGEVVMQVVDPRDDPMVGEVVPIAISRNGDSPVAVEVCTPASKTMRTSSREFSEEERQQQQEALKIDEDVDKIKAPRYLDIVSNRMNTVINLARIWSRRERKLFYMKDEETRLRRAAATIPKKRVGNEWEEMPLFLDGVSGKLVTVEGMAELWRERAQTFLNSLGKGQLIADFLPLYDLGQQNREKIAHTINTISGFAAKAVVRPVEKPAGIFHGRAVSNDRINKEEMALGKGDQRMLCRKTPKQKASPGVSKSGRKIKYTERAKTFQKSLDAENGVDVDYESQEMTVDDPEELLRMEEDLVQVLQSTKKPLPAKKATVPSEKASKKPAASKAATKKSTEGVFVPNIDKAKQALKARARATRGTRVRPEALTVEAPTIKGKRGRPPGFNPDRDSPFGKKPKLVITNISDIIGDAKKIIVQMETEEPPKSPPWKKQTARKSFVNRRPRAEADDKNREQRSRSTDNKNQKTSTQSKSTRSSSRSTRNSDPEAKRTSNEAKRSELDDLDHVDGPPRRSSRSQRDSSKTEQAPSDKGTDAGKGTKKGNESKKSDSTNSPKKSNDTSSTSKRAKTDSPSKSAAVSPRSAVLSPRSAMLPTAKSATPVRTAAPKRKDPPASDTKSKPAESKPKRQKIDPENMSDKKDTKTSKRDGKTVVKKANQVKDKNSDDSPAMPELEVEVSSQEYLVPESSDKAAASSAELLDVNNDTDSDETELGFIAYVKKTMKMVFHDKEAEAVQLVGTALDTSAQNSSDVQGDSWDVLVGSPTKSPPHTGAGSGDS